MGWALGCFAEVGRDGVVVGRMKTWCSREGFERFAASCYRQAVFDRM